MDIRKKKKEKHIKDTCLIFWNLDIQTKVKQSKAHDGNIIVLCLFLVFLLLLTEMALCGGDHRQVEDTEV